MNGQEKGVSELNIAVGGRIEDGIWTGMVMSVCTHRNRLYFDLASAHGGLVECGGGEVCWESSLWVLWVLCTMSGEWLRWVYAEEEEEEEEREREDEGLSLRL